MSGLDLPAWSEPFTDVAGLARRMRLRGIGRDWAWGGSTGAGIRVGIIDSGLERSHPRLNGRVVQSVAVELNDVAAFTCGKLFGRHPLRSNISPKKTWEGASGALAVSLLLPWALRFTFPHFQPRELLLAGLIVGIGGQLGEYRAGFEVET